MFLLLFRADRLSRNGSDFLWWTLQIQFECQSSVFILTCVSHSVIILNYINLLVHSKFDSVFHHIIIWGQYKSFLGTIPKIAQHDETHSRLCIWKTLTISNLYRMKLESGPFQNLHTIAQHDETHSESWLFQSWHTIAHHCEIHLEYYLNK